MMRPPTRNYQNPIFASDRWSSFRPRAGDIVISTSIKAGTTWAQAIVASLLWPDGAPPAPVNELSPWLELPVQPVEHVLALLEAQSHRRMIKTHLPANGLPLFDEVRYVTVGRDGRDVFVSLLHHWESMRPMVWDVMRELRPEHHAIGAFDGDVHRAFDEWISQGAFPWEGDGAPWHSHLEHVRSWWEHRHDGNVLRLHFDELLGDLDGQMRRVAEFLEVGVSDEVWPAVVERCTLEGMRRRWQEVVPERVVFEGDGADFLHRGESGQWRGVLDGDEVRRYEQRVGEVLPEDAAAWLAGPNR